MVDIEIEDGLLDCPKYGLIGELRCIESCDWHVSKDEDCVHCKFDENNETE